MSQTKRTKIFVSFAEDDRKWLERLRKRLDFLEGQGMLRSWDSTRVLPGKNWRDEQKQALAEARVAVLLLSVDFLASDAIVRDELPVLLAAAARGEVALLPVLVRPCMYKLLPGMADLKPYNSRPLADLASTDADDLLDQIVQSARDRLIQKEPAAVVPSLVDPDSNARAKLQKKAVILTALQAEYMAVRSHLKNLVEEKHTSGTIYERGTFSAGPCDWAVGILEIGAGNSRAAIEAERAIQFFAPSVMLFVGVAGGVKDVRIGDVVVATKVYGYEAGKATNARFLPRPSVGETTYSLEQRARAESRSGEWLQRLSPRPQVDPEVLVGPIAAGEKVIASARAPVARFLRESYGDTLAVEMEGRGFMEAARANQDVSAIIVRGISDLLSGKGKADAGGSQQLAARHASAFAFQLLAKL